MTAIFDTWFHEKLPQTTEKRGFLVNYEYVPSRAAMDAILRAAGIAAEPNRVFRG
ncbi:acetate kinase [Sphingomonas sp. PvP055]|uniref:hypothetical protein n=1 Tax=Sphingomonas sp. PvP055 TaxID=3156391 RepID=UPI0033956CA3